MFVRNALLTLLCQGPRHGYQLKAEFDAATGEIWPLNFGQVYPALKQLQQKGLVDEVDGLVDGAKADKRAYQANDAGRAEVAEWLSTPVARPLVDRDELSIKVLLAVATDLADPAAVIETQRAETMATLRSVTNLRAEAADGPAESEDGIDEPERTEAGLLAWQLHLDRMAIVTQSELRWLDLVEERLAERAQPSRAGDQPSPVEPDATTTTTTTTTATAAATEGSASL